MQFLSSVSAVSLLLLLFKQVCVCLPGANLTSNLDRIKIVFTPMMCRRVCSGGHCYNSCEKGDITTVYSEASYQQQQQQQQPQNQGFRLCKCWIQLLWSYWFPSLVLSLSHFCFLCVFFAYIPVVSVLAPQSSFFEVSWTKWLVSGMLSVLNTKLRGRGGRRIQIEGESWAENSPCQGGRSTRKESETWLEQIWNGRCKGGLICLRRDTCGTGGPST